MIKLFSHWIRGATLVRIVVDFAFVLIGIGTAITWVGSGLPVDANLVVIYALILALVALALNAWFGIYERRRDRSVYDTVARALMSLYVATPLAYLLFTLLPMADANRAVFELAVMAGIYGMLANRVRANLSTSSKLRVLIFGTGDMALSVEKTLYKSDPDVEIVGFYPSAVEEEPKVPAERILSKGMSLTDTVLTLKVGEIIVAVNERRGGVMPLKELLDCKLYGLRVLDLASHFEQRLGQIRLDSLRAGWLVFGEGFGQGFFRTLVKRISDIVGALCLLILALPVMFVTAILIVLEDGFPIFYRQERVGLNGRLFNVIKFRSMRTDAEKDGKPRWAAAKDDRTTRVGRIIRKLRIDELPQLYSVLKGDMSLVGPRPERPYFVDQLTKQIPFYAVRHSVKPGVTGWAQVRYHYGVSVEDAAEKLQYDLYYVKNNSLFLDFIVMFETVGVVLSARGAQ